MPRKHLIVSGIAKKQQQQAKIWMKIAKEIKASVKVGGSNIDSNPRLKAAIDKALQNNLSRDSIQKNINGSQKDESLMTDLEFEAYGPNGLAIIIKVLTDNNNRVLSSIRGYLNKFSGNLSKPNTAKTIFSYKGEIIISKEQLSEDDLLNEIIDFDIENIIENDDCFQIIINEKNFYEVRDNLKNKNFNIIESEIKYIPLSYANLNEEQFNKLEKFLDSCSNDDDIQSTITNFGEIIN